MAEPNYGSLRTSQDPDVDRIKCGEPCTNATGPVPAGHRYQADRAPARASFFIESVVPQYAENLKSLRWLKFDWGRSDLNQDHVYANQALTHKLNEFGIPHKAEEYNGVWGDKTWGDDGRIYNEVLPFFQKHLVFAANIDSSLK
jgi:hypothetical protein